jgi:phage shock protein PspC (stress-responsive transcriptional regulator)
MNETTTTRRDCPFCAEEIAATAIRCPHCRSRLLAFDAAGWRRDHSERKIAGVAAAIAHAMAVPVGFVRLGFVLLTFFHLLGPILYGLGALLIPARAGEPSTLERVLADGATTLRRWRTGEPPPPAPPAAFPGERAA